LLNFKISDNITYVGDFGFANSTQLSCIEIGKKVEYLGENCFENCINLKNVYFRGYNVPVFSSHLFHFCINLQTIIVPYGVKSIQDYAFSCCHNLSRIILPETCKYIGYRAFFKCNSLQQIYFNSNI
jgi:hypothetical protein